MSKKVVMIVRNSVLHDSRVMREAKALSENDYQVTILGMKEKKNQPSNINLSRVKVILIFLRTKNILPVNMFGWIIKYFEFILKSVIKTIKIKPSIIHAHDLDCLVPAYLGKLFSGAKLIYDSHEMYTETSNINKYEKSVATFLEKKLIKKPDAIITVCNSISEELSKRYKVSVSQIIMNCPENVFSGKKTNYIRKSLSINEKTTVLIYQGGLNRGRGIPTLISAMQHIHGCVLVFMGSGPFETMINKAVSKNKGKIFVIKPVKPEHIIEWTSSADIGVSLPEKISLNNYFSLPNKFFEYISAHTPVVVSDFPEMRSIVNRYKIGLTCDPADSMSIANSVNQIINNYSEYSKRESFEKTLKNYNWNNERKKLLKIYEEI